MTPSEWLDEIQTARKREKTFRKTGKEIREIYSNETDSPFNILYSNTETLLPAVFSNVPRPVIERRYKDEDPMGKSVAEASQRMLEYLCDTDIEDYDNYQKSITDAALDGLLPGRGVTAVKYESDEEVSWETACTDSIEWDKVYFGYAVKWSKMPWIAYAKFIDKDEAKELFEDTIIAKLKFTETEETEDDQTADEDKASSHRKTTPIYQLWVKNTKKVIYLSPNLKDEFLKEVDDPLSLTGFFNCPEPIQFVKKSNDLSPTALYTLYKNQAEELNKIQKRLNRVIDAIKVRGAYNGMLGEEIEKILKEDDNALIPTDNAAALMEGGFDKNIWLLPLAELMSVAQALIQARESAKRVIYEITGISDIVRGQSVASETLGAQKIKEAWGTMRLKTLQKEVQRYALDTMKLMLDVAINKFSEKSWAKMTGLPFSTTEQKENAEQMMQVMKQAAIKNPSIIQDPKAQQEYQKVQAILQKPYWGDILSVMQDNFGRSYRVDIETNSTLDVEATEDKQLIADFMNAMAQFLNGMGPLIEKQLMPFGAAKSMMLTIVKRFRFGREVEEELKAMQPPKPQQNPEMEKQQKEFQQAQQKFAEEQKQFKEKVTEESNRLTDENMKLNFDKKLAAMELKFQERLSLAQQNMNAVEAKSDLKEMIVKHRSDVQSMLDKHQSRVESCMAAEKAEKPESKQQGDITFQLPGPSAKVIKINRENGQIVGANVEEANASV